MRYIADLHLHSKFSRACSSALTPTNLDGWCRMKGVAIVATSDFTHPVWLKELKTNLEPAPEEGLFVLRSEERLGEIKISDKIVVPLAVQEPTRFILGTEIASIYSHGGQVRRVHNLVYLPSFSAVEKLISELDRRGCNLRSDGRPIIGLSSYDLLKITLSVDEKAMLIPAHAWTPHFAVFGSKSGYNSLQECFDDLAAQIFAVETGLSSDPEMNWQLSALDKIALVSSSDAHSLPNIGREANIFCGSEISYDLIREAIKRGNPKARAAGKHKEIPLLLDGTIEFYPHEGRYHYDGHRDCGVILNPEEADRVKKICPKCGRKLTVGVLSRVKELSDRAQGFKPEGAPNFVRLVELDKIIADAISIKSRTSPRVLNIYAQLLKKFGTEMNVLLDISLADLTGTHERLAEAMRRVREEKLTIKPGYDGLYGTIEIFSVKEKKKEKEQRTLF